jgi:hypothetical protein
MFSGVRLTEFWVVWFFEATRWCLMVDSAVSFMGRYLGAHDVAVDGLK